MKIAVSTLAIAVALSGCAVGHQAREAVRVNDGVAASAMTTTPPAGDGAPIIRRTNDMYFGVESFRKRRGSELPAKTEHVIVRSAGEVDIQGFATLVTRATGIPIALNVERTKAAAAAPAGGNPAGAAAFAAGQPQKATMPVQWEGPLSGLLDLVAARYGVDWEYTDGVVQITDERTETFVLHALPTTADLDAALASSNGGSGSGGSSGGSGTGGGASGDVSQGTGRLDAGQKATLDVWRDIQATVSVIVGDRGRYAITPANGTLTVTARPGVIAQVARFVRQQNEILTRQVFVRVKVYSVDISDNEDSSLNLTGAFANAAKTFGLGWTSPGTALQTPAGTFTASVIGANSEFAGSKVVARALSTAGRTSLISELTLTALNNRPAVKQDIRTQSYVERTAVTNQERSTTTEITPAKLSTGFSVNVLPRIISENRIIMAYALNLSSLVGIDRIAAGENFVQLPTIDSSGSMQETMLRSGEVLVLMGYLSDSAADRREGTGHPDNFLLGGTRQGSKAKRRVVITMEPTITSGSDN